MDWKMLGEEIKGEERKRSRKVKYKISSLFFSISERGGHEFENKVGFKKKIDLSYS